MTPAPTCAVHVDQLALGTCPRCGTYVCTRCVIGDSLVCSACRQRADGAFTPTPWERRAELGWVQGFWQTLKAMVMTPGAFFASVVPQGAPGDALSFAWVAAALSIPAVALNVVMQLGLMRLQLKQVFERLAERGSEVGPYREALEGIGFGGAILYAIVAALSTPVRVGFSAAVAHAGLVLFGAAEKGFKATFRAIGYVAGLALPVAVLGLVPGIGGLFGLAIIGYQVYAVAKLQQTTIGKALAGVLVLPLILSCCLGIGTLVVVVGLVSKLVNG
jgi:hypothetical protein